MSGISFGGAGGTGPAGPTGPAGASGLTATTTDFVQPAEGAAVTVLLPNPHPILIGETIFIQGAGYFTVTIVQPASIGAQSIAGVGNVAAGTVIAAGAKVVPSGVRGAAGANGATGPAGPGGGSGGRLTLTSGLPVTIADVVAAGTVYWTPDEHGSSVTLYDATGLVPTTIAGVETALVLGGLTAGKVYDVFGYNNAGALGLELGAAWTNDTTRADAVVRMSNGALLKNTDKTRKLLGTICATGAATTEDSKLNRYLSNLFNPVRRLMAVVDTTDSWTYTVAAWRQVRAQASNAVKYVACDASREVKAYAVAIANLSAATGVITVAAGVGIDDTANDSCTTKGTNSISNLVAVQVDGAYQGWPGLGRHNLNWLEWGGINGQFFGDGGSGASIQSGLTADVFG
jgi:hypothetical protein